jgi:hypothetical protein
MTSLSEDVALEQESVILFECRQGFIQGSRGRRDQGQFFGGKVVDVLVQRIAWVDFVLDAVEGGHQQSGEGQVAVAGRIRRPEFEAFGLGRLEYMGMRMAALRLRLE